MNGSNFTSDYQRKRLISSTKGPDFTSDYQRKRLIRILLRTAQILLLVFNENNLCEFWFERLNFYLWLSTKTTNQNSGLNGSNFTSGFQRRRLIRNLLRTAQSLLLIINENDLSKIYYLSEIYSNPAHGEVYSIQHYVIKFVRNLWQVDGFLRVSRFPPLIKLTATK